jgi:DNA-binding Xre family transcriptional regulator
MLLYTVVEDAALLALEMFKKRLVVFNVNLEKLEKLCAPLDTPPTSLLRLPFKIHL